MKYQMELLQVNGQWWIRFGYCRSGIDYSIMYPRYYPVSLEEGIARLTGKTPWPSDGFQGFGYPSNELRDWHG